MYSGGPRIAELNALLDKEIQLLNAIEKKWFLIRKYCAAKKTEQKLDEIGAPVKWIGYKSISLKQIFFSILIHVHPCRCCL